MKRKKMALYLISLLLFWSGVGFAENSFDNGKALDGVSEAKVYFDVTIGDPAVLVGRMDLIERSLVQLEDSGVATQAVVGFRAAASRYITADEHYVLEEEIESKRKIQGWIKKFALRGVIVEQCSLAAHQQGISYADFMPEVSIVQNGYVSLIGYQAKGFAVIPMD